MHFVGTIKTSFRGYPSLTAELNELVASSGVQQGLCLVTLAGHTTGLAITSFWDPRGLDDLMDELDRNFPSKVHVLNQRHPFDASGRVKSAVVGSSALLLIDGGKLILGSSQGLVLLEFDGPRERVYRVDIFERPVTVQWGKVSTEFMGMHDLTADINAMIAGSGVHEGICHVSVMHSTAGILLCDRDEAARADIMEDIERLVPTRADFKHRETAADAGGHVKTAFTDTQLTLPISQGKLLIGPEQAVVFAEFDGPRPRSYAVGIVAGEDGKEIAFHG